MADKKKEEEKMLLYAEYLVEAIDGDYAHLIRTDNPGNAEQEDSAKLVARALLPPDMNSCNTGSKNKEYRVK